MKHRVAITVAEARGIQPKDSNGLSDPYVLVRVGDQKARTKTIKETLTPSWNETFTMEVKQNELVFFECWDRDTLKSDDFEGTFSVNLWALDEFVQTGATKAWFKLREGHGPKMKGPVSGEVLLQFKREQIAREDPSFKCWFGDLHAQGEYVQAAHRCRILDPATSTTGATAQGILFLTPKHVCVYAEYDDDRATKVCFPIIQIDRIQKHKHNALLIVLKTGIQKLTTVGNVRLVFGVLQDLLRPTTVPTRVEVLQTSKTLENFLFMAKDAFVKCLVQEIEDPLGVIRELLKSVTLTLEESAKLGTLQSFLSEAIEGAVTALFQRSRNSGGDQVDNFLRVITKSLDMVLLVDDLQDLLPQEVGTDEILLGPFASKIDTLIGSICQFLSSPSGTTTGISSREMLNEWVRRAFDVDKHVAVGGHANSTAVIDCFDAISSFTAQFKKLKPEDPFAICQVAEVVTNALALYGSLEEERALRSVSDMPSFCVCVSNVEKSCDLLNQTVESLEEALDHIQEYKTTQTVRVDVSKESLENTVSSCIENSRAVIDKCVTSFVSQMPGIGQWGAFITQNIADNFATKIVNALDECLLEVSQKVSKPLFRCFLQKSWEAMFEVLKVLCKPQKKSSKKEGTIRVTASLAATLKGDIDMLLAYFHAEGEGLSVAQLESCQPFREFQRTIALYTASTEEIIAARRAASGNRGGEAAPPELEGVPLEDIQVVLDSRSHKGDREASAFKHELGGSSLPQWMREHFGLPPTELALKKYNCWMGKTPGVLYMTQRHICFESLVGITKESSAVRFAMLLKEIDAMRPAEHNKLKLVFGGVVITTSSDETILFTNFGIHRSHDIVKTLAKQARAAGNAKLPISDDVDGSSPLWFSSRIDRTSTALWADVSAVATGDAATPAPALTVFASCDAAADAEGEGSAEILLENFATGDVFVRVDTAPTSRLHVELETRESDEDDDGANSGRARQARQPKNNTQCNAAKEIGHALPLHLNGVSTCSHELSEVSDCGHDNETFSEHGLWYTFVGNGTRLVASTCTPDGAGGLLDTAIEVFSGQCQDNETAGENESVCEAYGNDECGSHSDVNFFAENGKRYWIFVHGWGEKCGTINFMLVHPANEYCTAAVAIPSETWSYSGDTSLSARLHSGCRNASTTGQWFRGVGTGADLVASTCGAGTDFDTVVEVYSDCVGLGEGSHCVAYNDNVCGKASALSFKTSAGVPYYVFVSGSSIQRGQFTLSISPASGSDCASASAVNVPTQAPIAGTISSTRSGFLLRSSDPVISGNGNWSTFAGNGKQVRASVCLASNSSSVGVYVLSACAAISGQNVGAAPIAWKTGRQCAQVSLLTVPYVTYYLAVQSNSSEQFSLNISEEGSGTTKPTCVDATHVASYPSATTVDTRPLRFSKQSSCMNTTQPGAWIMFTGDGSTLTVSTCDTFQNAGSSIEIVAASSCNTTGIEGQCVMKINTNGCSKRSRASFLSTKGQQYYAYIHGSRVLPLESQSSEEVPAEHHKHKRNLAWIAAPIVGGFVLIVVLVVATVLIVKKVRQNRREAVAGAWINLEKNTPTCN
eukprot:m51a1_g6430 putative multiple c2 and transmembrane domain-containing protein 1-like isoform x2 (1566) ;mRNA; r:348362-357282